MAGTERLPAAVLLGFRIVGAALSAVMGGIHLYLWFTGYRDIPLVAPSFLVNAVGAALLTVALLVTSVRWLGVVAALGTMFTAGSLAALLLSLTVGLFGFQEFLAVPLVSSTLAVESVSTLLLGVLSLLLGRSTLARLRGDQPVASS